MGSGYHGGFGNTEGKKSEFESFETGVACEKIVARGIQFVEELLSVSFSVFLKPNGARTSSVERSISKFKLYCAFYSLIKSGNSNIKDRELSDFLSRANPFDSPYESSSDPQIYNYFCNVIKVHITIANSYGLLSKYLNSLNNPSVSRVFYRTTKLEWSIFFENYLNYLH